MCGTCSWEALGPAKRIWGSEAPAREGLKLFRARAAPALRVPRTDPSKHPKTARTGPGGSRRTGTVWLPMLQTTQTPWLHAVQNVVWMSLPLGNKWQGVRFPPGGVPLRGDACPILTVKPVRGLFGRMSREPKSHPADRLPGPPEMPREKNRSGPMIDLGGTTVWNMFLGGIGP